MEKRKIACGTRPTAFVAPVPRRFGGATASWLSVLAMGFAIASPMLGVGCDASDGSGVPTDSDAEDWRRNRHDSGTLDAATTGDADAGGATQDGGGTTVDSGGGTPDSGADSSTATLAPCDQTLSVRANLASAIAGAAAGTTICLNSGNHGSLTLSGVVKTSDVTVRSTSGKTALIGLALDGTKHLKFQNLTIAGMDMNSGTNSNIAIVGNVFTDQLLVIGSGSSATPANILIDGNTFDAISVCTSCAEGRLQLYDAGGVTVSNNHFGNAGESDGIQWGGYGGTVGPGNVFDGLIQGNYGRHIDAIQAYGNVDHHTITGNYFVNNTVAYAAYDGGANITFTNNVLLGQGGYGQLIFGSIDTVVARHNVISNAAVGCDNKSDLDPSTDCHITDNVMLNDVRVDISKCINCSESYNLADQASVSYCASEPTCGTLGTNLLTGTPVFVGGSSPTTWAGYELASTSLGYKSASDGTNRGINTQ